MHKTNNEQAHKFFDNIRKTIETTKFIFQDTIINVTISFGVAQISDSQDNNVQWAQAADKALYQAKHQGRNQGVIFENMLK